jgi:hypothetical protein
MKTMIGAALAFAFLGSAATAQMAAGKMAAMAAMAAMAKMAAMAAMAAMAKMAPGDMQKVDHCKAMKHDAMMANATCQKMMKL